MLCPQYTTSDKIETSSKNKKTKCYQKHLPDGTIAKARALFSSITDASAEMEFKPCTSHKKSSGK